MAQTRPAKGTRPAMAQTRPAKGTRLEMFWPMDDAWYPGTVGDVSAEGKTRIVYDDGDVEWLVVAEEQTRPIAAQQMVEVETAVPAPVDEWDSALRDRGKSELGESQYMDLAVRMQEKALRVLMRNNYAPKAKKFCDFCESKGWECLPASEELVPLYVCLTLVDRQSAGGVDAAVPLGHQPRPRGEHEDMGIEGPAKGVQ
eukprot:gene20923-biopygen21554